MDNKFGFARPKFPSFLLNSAVDALFKKEFDIHRANGDPHPLMNEYGVDAVYAGHLHNNAQASYNGIKMITTNAAGRPLGKAEPGYRLIEINDGVLSSEYIPIMPE